MDFAWLISHRVVESHGLCMVNFSGLWSHIDFAWLISQGCGVTGTLHG